LLEKEAALLNCKAELVAMESEIKVLRMFVTSFSCILSIDSGYYYIAIL
jgi:hypothetical protein